MSTRQARVERVRNALSVYTHTRHDDFVRALAIGLLASSTKRRIGFRDVRTAYRHAVVMLSRLNYDIPGCLVLHVTDDYPYAEISFKRGLDSVRLQFLEDEDDGTWDMYPSVGTTPSRQRAQRAYEKFHLAE